MRVLSGAAIWCAALLAAGCATQAPRAPQAASAPAQPLSGAAGLQAELDPALASLVVPGAAAAGRVLLRIGSEQIFAADSAALTAAGSRFVDALAVLLRRRGDAGCEVAVYTDAIGGALDNATLARHRGEALIAALRAAGVASPRLQVGAAGAGKPLAGNDTPEGRRQNRRIEILLRPGSYLQD